MVAFEKEKIQGAIRTDFILSAEIITITLGTVAAASFGVQLSVLAGIAVIMTVGVYGLVAGIVKLDDAGLYLSQQPGEGLPGRVQRAVGALLLRAAPYLMKGLAVVGTAAMFLVGGGILTHGMPGAHELIHYAGTQRRWHSRSSAGRWRSQPRYCWTDWPELRRERWCLPASQSGRESGALVKKQG